MVTMAKYDNMKFRVLYLDPPWTIPTPSKSKNGGAKWFHEGKVLSVEQLTLASLPAMDNSMIFLWSTASNLHLAIPTMAAWGFQYKTCLIWVKVSKAGNPIMGQGGFLRHAHEQLLVGVRGKVPIRDKTVRSVIMTPPNRSACRKPVGVYDIIERMVDGPYLELFARTRRPGWFVYGNDVEGGSDISIPEWEVE